MRLLRCLGLLLSLGLTAGSPARAAVTVLPVAVPGVTLPRTGGTDPATGLTFDSLRGYYYGNAANNNRVDGFVWDTNGVLVQRLKPINVDARALNYNPNTQAVEAMTVSAHQLAGEPPEPPLGLITMGRDANGLFTGVNSQVRRLFPGLTGGQSAPVYDPARDWFYAPQGGETVRVVSRSTGEQVGEIKLDLAAAGTTDAAAHAYSIGYDPEREVLINVSAGSMRRVAYVFDLAGAYVGSSVLPLAPRSSEWGLAYANGQVFITDSRDPDGSWKGYTIFSPVPEPACLGFVALGTVTLLGRHRRSG